MCLPISSHPGTASTRAEATVGDLLVRVAAEITTTAETAADLQSALSPILEQSGASLASRSIQGLDLLEQTLRDLGAVLREIAARPASSQPIDSALVLERCKLAAVARRLGGLETESASDDLELF